MSSTIQYHNANGILDSKWVDTEALLVAKSFFKDTKEDKVTSSQLRKFYADIKSLERKWQSSGHNEDSFLRILPMIKLLKSKSEYSYKRKVMPENFKDWIWKHVDAVNDGESFKAFLLHFEAVVGFSKV